jgi:malonyl-CoA O-methyltransferase
MISPENDADSMTSIYSRHFSHSYKSFMASRQPPTIDPIAASRWWRAPLSESPWLHDEVARRMEQRLDWIKRQPASWVHWAPVRGGMQVHRLLAKRYPKAFCTVLECSPARVRRAAAELQSPWWTPQRWCKPQAQVTTELPQSAQMLWSNMGLHMAADPQALIAQWHRALQVDGFLMFSCLGPDTLLELRSLYRSLGWPEPCHEFTDMHDWGDMLVAAGFAEPVMDMERISLSFESPQRLLQELRGLGHNLHVGRFPSLRGRQWHAQLLQALASQPLQLTFEVVYGHAFKPEPKLAVSARSEISLDRMRSALARGKAGSVNNVNEVNWHG